MTDLAVLVLGEWKIQNTRVWRDRKKTHYGKWLIIQHTKCKRYTDLEEYDVCWCCKEKIPDAVKIMYLTLKHPNLRI